ncbi:hypothetical protein J7643_06325 [bacterium]|nr:hypothetical protein [bacterium]
MRALLVLGGLTACLVGCAVASAPKETEVVARWTSQQTAPVITRKWMAGFVPAEAWKVDTLRVYGDGRWVATRAFAPVSNRPDSVVASGSLSQDALREVLDKAFERSADGTRFVDLPARVESGIADVSAETLSLSIENASHSVSLSGTTPPAYRRFAEALTARTIAVPFD